MRDSDCSSGLIAISRLQCARVLHDISYSTARARACEVTHKSRKYRELGRLTWWPLLKWWPPLKGGVIQSLRVLRQIEHIRPSAQPFWHIQAVTLLNHWVRKPNKTGHFCAAKMVLSSMDDGPIAVIRNDGVTGSNPVCGTSLTRGGMCWTQQLGEPV